MTDKPRFMKSCGVYGDINCARNYNEERNTHPQARLLGAMNGLAHLCRACEGLLTYESINWHEDLDDARADIVALAFSFSREIKIAMRYGSPVLELEAVFGFSANFLELFDSLTQHLIKIDRLEWEKTLGYKPDAIRLDLYSCMGTDLAVAAVKRLVSILLRDNACEAKQLREIQAEVAEIQRRTSHDLYSTQRSLQLYPRRAAPG